MRSFESPFSATAFSYSLAQMSVRFSECQLQAFQKPYRHLSILRDFQSSRQAFLVLNEECSGAMIMA